MGQPYPWSSWAVLPFKLSGQGTGQDPNELIAFPGHLTRHSQPSKWQETMIDGKSVVILNSSVPPANADERERFLRDTNLAIMARKNTNYIMVMRTACSPHPDQFMVYNGQPQYVELEATGPCVGKGEKSTTLIQLDFVPLNQLAGLNFTCFGSSPQGFQTQVRQVLGILLKSPGTGFQNKNVDDNLIFGDKQSIEFNSKNRPFL